MTAAPRTSGKRSDATRNVESILDASVGVLSARPEASMADIAKASGLSRQTLYAHFPSRDALLQAVADQALARATASIDLALGSATDPREQLTLLIPAWWETVAQHAEVLGVLGSQLAQADGQAIRQFHDPILKRLEDLASRGQGAGEFTSRLSPAWLASAFLGLVHTAAADVSHGRMDRNEACSALEISIPGVFGTEPRAGSEI